MHQSAPIAERLIAAADRLSDAVDALSFDDPVTHTYNPLQYAHLPHERYVVRFASGPKRVVFWGMNPGPWGMAQTGIPFGEISFVRDWMGITEPVGTPRMPHPKRPIEGFQCSRSEVSGRRLWGLMQRRFETAEQFFAEHYVANYCPLVFMESSGRNRTPDKLAPREREPLFAACDEHLRTVVRLLQPEWVIGVGKFAQSRLESALSGLDERPTVAGILHPSPANPRANRGWESEAEGELERLGVWS